MIEISFKYYKNEESIELINEVLARMHDLLVAIDIASNNMNGANNEIIDLCCKILLKKKIKPEEQTNVR